jgi:hypothetical protein
LYTDENAERGKMDRPLKSKDIKIRIDPGLYQAILAQAERERRPSMSDMARVLLEDGLQARSARLLQQQRTRAN